MPQLNPEITVNYNRVTAPFSRFGTRRLQPYQITVYGVSDAHALYTTARSNAASYEEWVAASAEVGITVETVDTHSYQIRWPSNGIHSAILKGAGDVAEIYYTSFFDEDNYDPDDNRIRVTVFVAEDTFVDGERNDYEFWRNMSMNGAIFNQISGFDWGSISVYRVDLFGSSWYDAYDPTEGSVSGPYALKREVGSTRPFQETKSEIAARLRRR